MSKQYDPVAIIQNESLTEAGSITKIFVLHEVSAIQLIANYADAGDVDLDASVTFTTSNHPENLLPEDAVSTRKYKGVLPPKWSTESGVSFTAITTAAQDEMVNIGNIGAKWGRLVITWNSGGGSVTAFLAGRD